jgi:hypothetical protein
VTRRHFVEEIAMARALGRVAVLVTVASLWTVFAHAQNPAAEVASGTSSGASNPAQGALGDLSGFRAIALDTLRTAQAGDLSAARKRMDELESTWNDAAPKLKRQAPEKWKKVDAAIDRAERELRFWRARRTDTVQALQELVRTIDSIE